MNKPSLFHRLSGRILTLSLGLFLGTGTGRVVADDTEIFFPEEVVQEGTVVRPNLLFLMDTSGSMTGLDGGNISRLQRMKNALSEVLDNLGANINVGLGRMSGSEGGAILFPAADLDAIAADIDPSLRETVQQTAPSAGTNGEAYQNDTTVRLGPALASDVLLLGTGGAATTETVTVSYSVDSAGDEAEQYDGSTNSNRRIDTAGTNGTNARLSNDIELTRQADGTPNFDTRYVGLRFKNVAVPKAATITSARLIFYCSNSSQSTDAANNIVIVGDDTNSSPAFDSSDWDNVTQRISTATSASTTWRPTGTGRCDSVNKEIRTADISNIVGEIRDRGGWSLGNSMSFLLTLQNESNNNRRAIVKAFQGNGTQYSPRLEITYETTGTATPSARQQFGLKFENVLIPRGVTVTSARIKFKGLPTFNPARTQNGVTLPVSIGVTASNFTSTLNAVSSAPTGNEVTWNIPSMSNGSVEYTTPELASIISARTALPDWCGGRALNLTFKLPAGSPVALRAFTSGFTPENAPVLEFSYNGSDAALDNSCTTSSTARSITNDDDDAVELSSTGGLQASSSALIMGRSGSGSSYNNYALGLRFDAINLPPQSTILSAHIEFTASSDDSSPLSLSITGENSGTPAPFTTGTNVITGRTRTAPVPWNNVTNWSTTAPAKYSTPDLTPIVQTLVRRPDWAKGNTMAFIIESSGLSGNNNNRRRAVSSDTSDQSAPKLVIKAEVPTGRLTVRQYLKVLVSELPAAGNTPIPEFLYEAAQYWRGGNAYFGKTRGDGAVTNDNDNISAEGVHRISGQGTFVTPPTIVEPCTATDKSSASCASERIEQVAAYKSPFTDLACSTNAQILLTDGEPNDGTNFHSTIRSNLGIQSCQSGVGGATNAGNCAKEIAALLANNDQSSLSGSQTVNTYTVGLAEAGLAPYLTAVADAGKGGYYSANSADDLVNAFTSIVTRVLDIPTTFVAPAVSVDSFNRLTDRNEIYFALFRPDVETRWAGNFKRYKIGPAGIDNVLSILDANNSLAVDPGTGFFSQNAQSIWSAARDGDDVAKGGVASLFTTTRNAYTITGDISGLNAGNGTPTAVNLTTHSLSEGNTAITAALLGITGTAAVVTDRRDKTLKYARGIDINDQDEDNSTSDARNALGDPLHSEPALVTYGGTAAAPEVVAFFGTNQGGLHAVNASTGAELWSWVPQELLPNLENYAYNEGNFQNRPYGVDGPITPLFRDDASTGTMHYPFFSSGKKIFLYVGLRMGGRQYYALDVTDRNTPMLKFIIRGGNGPYRELGQSWAKAVPARIRVGGAIRSVIVISGGYDPNQDGGSVGSAVPPIDSMGRALYIVDSNTGERIWWGGINPGGADAPDEPMPSMKYSVPASPKVIDLDGDGLSDRIYIADTGGQIFRFDLNPANSGAGDLATGTRIASLGSAHLPADDPTRGVNGRRFYQAPDLSIIRVPGVTPFLSIAIGSGYRGHPLSKDTEDRFFMIRDPDVSKSAAELPRRINEDNAGVPILASDLYNATDNAIGSPTAATVNAAKVALADAPGYYVSLRPSSTTLNGEKVLTDAQTFDGKVLFTTYTPAARSVGATCRASAGLSRFYLFSIVDGQPVNNYDNIGDVDELTQTDRYTELAQGGLPPTPTILFPTINGTLPEETLVCVGAECFDPGFTLRAEKTYWIKRQ